MEIEGVISLECGIGAANCIELGDQRDERVGLIAIALTNFVFLAVEVFFGFLVAVVRVREILDPLRNGMFLADRDLGIVLVAAGEELTNPL